MPSQYVDPNSRGVYNILGYWNPNVIYLGAFTDDAQTQARPGGGGEVLYAGAYWEANYYNASGLSPLESNQLGGYWKLAPTTPSGGANVPNYAPAVPNAPKNLQAGYTSAKSVALFWDPAYVPGLGAVTSYDVFDNGIKIGTTTTTSFTATGLAPSSTNNFTIAANDAKGTSAKSAALSVQTKAADTVSSGKYFSPYVDMTLPSTNILAMSAASGLRDFTLAFMQAAGLDASGNYVPGTVPTLSWGGLSTTLLPTGTIIQQVKAVEAEGGTVTVSFGGYSGRDPALIAESYSKYLQGPGQNYSKAAADSIAATNLQAEYQSVMTTFGVNALDFDVEPDTVNFDSSTVIDVVSDTYASTLRDTAIKKLEAANPNLKVSFTVQVELNGLNQKGYDLLAKAKADGVRIDTVNIMAMDYGPNTQPGDMAEAAIAAAKKVWLQLTTGLNGKPGLGLTSTKVGITPMIGQNDTVGNSTTQNEVFTTADAQILESFAASTPWVAGLGEWELPRDSASTVDATGSAPNSTSSGVVQSAYQFAHTLGQVTQATGAHAEKMDFNADGTSDILLRNPSTGVLYNSSVVNGAVGSPHSLMTLPAGYMPSAVADFDGNSIADILLRNTTTGDLRYYTIDSSGKATWHSLGALSTAYSIVGTGDFDGNGSSDILLQNTTSHALFYDKVSGNTKTQVAIAKAPTGYTAVGAGDFNDDGVSDVLLRNTTTGNLIFDQMGLNGAKVTPHTLGTVSTAYAVAGTGDINHDGISDILFFNSSTGGTAYDTVSSTGAMTWHDLGNVVPGSTLVGMDDFTGQGAADLLFRNDSTGATSFYEVGGASPGLHAMGTIQSGYTAIKP